MNPILIEVCIESVEDARAVAATGADRIELCSALALGGLTPSAGLLAEVRSAVELPIISMIRPRSGGFCYSAAEMRVMRRDIDAALEGGVESIVFGVLNADGSIDRAATKEIVRHVRSAGAAKQIVFHRAFDFTPSPLAALDELIDLGIDRVLTSGQRQSAVEGAALIRALIDRAGEKIEILPGAGIRPENVLSLVRETGCRQVHVSVREPVNDPSLAARPNLPLAGAGAVSDGNDFAATSAALLGKLLRAVRDCDSSLK